MDWKDVHGASKPIKVYMYISIYTYMCVYIYIYIYIIYLYNATQMHKYDILSKRK